MNRTGCLLIFLLALAPALHAQDPEAAARRVEEGLVHWRAGDPAAAAGAFAAAQAELPGDPRIAFDRGCAALAQRDAAAAVDALREAATAKDPALSLRARYNLGHALAAQARAALGERPEGAEPDTRRRALDHLDGAAGQFRDCLRRAPGLDPALGDDARHNLEWIRQYARHLEEAWAEEDRRRQEKEEKKQEDPLALLEALYRDQRALRVDARSSAPASAPDLETRQRDLAERARALPARIAALLAPQGATGSPPDSGEDAVKPWLEEMGARIHGRMDSASEHLRRGRHLEAAKDQTEALSAIDTLWTTLVPFPTLVPRGVETQASALETTRPLAPPDSPRGSHALSDLAEEQTRLARWAASLDPKARAMLEGMDGSGAPPPQPGDEQQKADALRAALRKGIELGPRIVERSKEAVTELDGGRPDQAIPDQTEALALWKEIADLLPKDDSKPQPKPDQDGPSGEDPQKPPDPESGDPKDPSQKPESPQPKEPQPSDPKERAKEQAETMLRKALEREREIKERHKKLRQILMELEKVDKDW